MDRLYLLAPALILLATMVIALVVYAGLCALGHPPNIVAAKHNQLFGPFLGRYLVWLLSPIERLLHGRVSPNGVTLLSVGMCAITGLAAGLGHLAGAVWLYAFAGFLDALDGRLARLGNSQSPAGALFDSVSDRWGELFVFAGYAWFLHDSPWLLAVFAAMAGSMMVSYTRARAEALGVAGSGGMMQRAERVALVAGGTLIAAWYGADPETLDAVVPIVGVVMVVCGLASSATAINRAITAMRELRRRSAIEIAPTVPVLTAPSLANDGLNDAVVDLPLPPPPAFTHKVRPLEQH